MSLFLRIFAACMKQGRIETITTRVISTTFIVGALAVFKPFGLDAWQWQAYVHLVALGVIGIFICMLTDIILKYIVKMPRSFKKGAEYIIRRNLWFQLINTPLVAPVINTILFILYTVVLLSYNLFAKIRIVDDSTKFLGYFARKCDECHFFFVSLHLV